jgi:glucans biosynthesis protein
MHGGAPGSGAPPGNQNAFKHGRYTKAAMAERRALRQLIADARETLRSLERNAPDD